MCVCVRGGGGRVCVCGGGGAMCVLCVVGVWGAAAECSKVSLCGGAWGGLLTSLALARWMGGA